MASKSPPKPKLIKRPLDPFRRAVLRGLGVLLPPLLTIVIFLWVGKTVVNYVLEPMEQAARWVLVEYTPDIRPIDDVPQNLVNEMPSAPGVFRIEDDLFVETSDGNYIPQHVNLSVQKELGKAAMPDDAHGIYEAYIDQQYLQRQYVVPVFLGVFVLALYLLGKFLAAGVGRLLWAQFEKLITTLPIVSNVYSSVKQVTDFMFTEKQIEATRVVAIEYPRRGIWTLALVTGESMLDIRAAANEPVLSVLVPTSPMPFTGFTMTVRKSETIDLDITVDQALQFVVSCGVVVPPHQLAAAIENQEKLRATDSSSDST
ncbi:MAG: DUF502 domain-containing protein, partial [Aeoliella sp.]